MQNTPARPGEVNMADRRVSGFKSELGRDGLSRARVGRLLAPTKAQAITIASLLRWAVRNVLVGLCHIVSLVPAGTAVPAGSREFADVDALFGLESAAERDAEVDKYVSAVIAGAYVVLKGTQAQVEHWETKCAECPEFEALDSVADFSGLKQAAYEAVQANMDHVHVAGQAADPAAAAATAAAAAQGQNQNPGGYVGFSKISELPPRLDEASLKLQLEAIKITGGKNLDHETFKTALKHYFPIRQQFVDYVERMSKDHQWLGKDPKDQVISFIDEFSEGLNTRPNVETADSSMTRRRRSRFVSKRIWLWMCISSAKSI